MRRDLRRGDRVPGADAARARPGPDPQRRAPRRRRRHAPRPRPPHQSQETDLPVHLVDAPLECVVLGAGRCLESFDSLKEHVHGALSRALTDSRQHRSRSVRVVVEEVFGGLADLPVAVLERGARARLRPRGRRTRRARARRAGGSRACRRSRRARPASPAGSPSAPSAATAASRTSGSSCAVAAATSAGDRARGRVASFAERERGGLGDPRVVVAEQRRASGATGIAPPSAGAVSAARRRTDAVGIRRTATSQAGSRDRDRCRAARARAECGGADPGVGIVGRPTRAAGRRRPGREFGRRRARRRPPRVRAVRRSEFAVGAVGHAADGSGRSRLANACHFRAPARSDPAARAWQAGDDAERPDLGSRRAAARPAGRRGRPTRRPRPRSGGIPLAPLDVVGRGDRGRSSCSSSSSVPRCGCPTTRSLPAAR